MMRRWVILALVVTGILISYLDRGNLSLAAVPIMNEDGYSAVTMGTLLSCFFWSYAIFQIPSGLLIDRYGIRRVYACAFLLWSCASAGFGLSRSFSEFLTARLVLGMAESFAPVASLAYIRSNFSEKERGVPTAVYVAGLTAGPAFGALLGSYVLARFGWRSLFIITGVGALIWLAPWLALAPRENKRADRIGFESFPVAAAIKEPALWAISLCTFLFSYYWYFVLTWVPAYLTVVHKFNTIEMGRVLAVSLFAMALMSIVAGWITDRVVRLRGRPFVISVRFCGVGLAGAGCLLLLVIIPARTWLLPVLLVSLCSMGVGSAGFWALAQLTIPARMVGRGIGYLNTVAQIAGAAAPLITGCLIGPQKQFTAALILAGLCPILASAALLGAGPMRLQTLRNALDRKLPPAALSFGKSWQR